MRNVKTSKQRGGQPLGMLTISLSFFLFHTYTLSGTHTVNSVFLPQATCQCSALFAHVAGCMHTGGIKCLSDTR